MGFKLETKLRGEVVGSLSVSSGRSSPGLMVEQVPLLFFFSCAFWMIHSFNSCALIVILSTVSIILLSLSSFDWQYSVNNSRNKGKRVFQCSMRILSSFLLRQNFFNRMCFFIGHASFNSSPHLSSQDAISSSVKRIRKSLITVFSKLWISSKKMLTERGRISMFGGGVPFSLDFDTLDLGFSGPNSSVSYLTFFLRKLFYLLSCLISRRRNSSLLVELRLSSLYSRDLIGVGFVFLDSEG